MRTARPSSAAKKTRRTVGVRDAKARLSELLRDVQLGHEWMITERGKPIARLIPIAASEASLEERLVRVVKSGVIDNVLGYVGDRVGLIS